MKNVTTSRLSGFMDEGKKGRHAELVSASSAREPKFRWTLNQVQGDGLTVSTGFTLIELLVVVLIVGILAAIALPQYQRVKVKTDIMQVNMLLRDVYKAEKMYYLANGTYTRDIRDLDVVIKNSPRSGGFSGWRFDVYRGDIETYLWGIVYRNWKEMYDIRVYYDGTASTCTPMGSNPTALASYACKVWLETWENH